MISKETEIRKVTNSYVNLTNFILVIIIVLLRHTNLFNFNNMTAV